MGGYHKFFFQLDKDSITRLVNFLRKAMLNLPGPTLLSLLGQVLT